MWSLWILQDDFINTRSETYKTSNLYDEALDSISVNVMIYCAQDGTTMLQRSILAAPCAILALISLRRFGARPGEREMVTW